MRYLIAKALFASKPSAVFVCIFACCAVSGAQSVDLATPRVQVAFLEGESFVAAFTGDEGTTLAVWNGTTRYGKQSVPGTLLGFVSGSTSESLMFSIYSDPSQPVFMAQGPNLDIAPLPVNPRGEEIALRLLAYFPESRLLYVEQIENRMDSAERGQTVNRDLLFALPLEQPVLVSPPLSHFRYRSTFGVSPLSRDVTSSFYVFERVTNTDDEWYVLAKYRLAPFQRQREVSLPGPLIAFTMDQDRHLKVVVSDRDMDQLLLFRVTGSSQTSDEDILELEAKRQRSDLYYWNGRIGLGTDATGRDFIEYEEPGTKFEFERAYLYARVNVSGTHVLFATEDAAELWRVDVQPPQHVASVAAPGP